MSSDKPYLTRGELAEFLTGKGYPIAKSTLDKLCAPARGEGPAPAKLWLGRPLYQPEAGLAWAESRATSAEAA
jgi:hypothetical protein